MDNPMQSYLRIVKDLETTLYTQKRIGNHLQQQGLQLGKPKDFRNVTTYVSPSTDYQDEYKAKYFKIGTVVCGVVFAFLLLNGISSVGGNIMGAGLFGLLFILAGCTIAGAIVAFIPRFIGGEIGRKMDEDAAKSLTAQNAAQLEKMKKDDALRVEKENKVKARLKAQCEAIQTEFEKTKDVLMSYYDLNVIYPKYRGFAAISTICEYFETGRCTTLEGHEGAYNLYEQELQMKKVHDKLDVVITNLEQIKQNQYYLYEALTQVNSTLQKVDAGNQRMLQSMQVLQENMALIEYNTRCTNARAAAIADMMVMQQLLK